MNLTGRTSMTVLTASLGLALVGCRGAAQAAPAASQKVVAQAAAAEDTVAKAAAEPDDACAAIPGNRIVFPV